VLVAFFALTPPLLSHDVYSYIDYARLGAVHGLNPYAHTPRAAPGDSVFAQVDWKGVTSVYGPLFTLASYSLAKLPVGTAVLALKAVSAASTLVLALIVARIAPARGVDPVRAAAFVALNPLVLVHVVGGPHNDVLAMVFAMLAAGATLAVAEGVAGAGFVVAVAVKASAGFAAPFALLGATRRRRMLLGALAAAVPIALVSTLAFGWEWLSVLGVAGGNLEKTSYMSLPVRLSDWTGIDRDAVRIIALYIYVAFFAYLLVQTWRGADWLRAAGWAGAGLLLTTTWLLPWYLIWVLPLAALSRDRTLKIVVLALTALLLGTRIPL
jgi:alpha-1,6-mannosyltransferase